MAGFQRGDIILHHAAQPHHFEGVCAQGFLMMVAEGDEQKKAGQERDDDDADRGSGEEFEMKMFRAEKPRGAFGRKRLDGPW